MIVEIRRYGLLVCAKSVLILLAVVSASSWAEAPYTLRPGDLLGVSVWGEEQLNRQVRVLPDGSISFPLVGQVVARDLKLAELEEALEAALDEYIPAPDVSISIDEANGNRIFVVGGVQAPGEYQMLSPLTVMQALALSGGLTAFADNSGIRVLRGTGESQMTLEVKYNRIMQGKDLSTNYTLEAGDTLMVPQ